MTKEQVYVDQFHISCLVVLPTRDKKVYKSRLNSPQTRKTTGHCEPEKVFI